MSIWDSAKSSLAPAAAFTIPAVLGDMKTAKAQGKSPLEAGVGSIVRNNWMNVVMLGSRAPTMGFFALGLMATAPAAAYTGIRNFSSGYNLKVRQSLTPFSGSYEHSDITMSAQQRGMSTINGYRSILGSEAAALAQRYSRR